MIRHEELKATPETTNISLDVPLSREFDVFLNEYLDAKDDEARKKIFDEFLGEIGITKGHGIVKGFIIKKARDKVTKTCVKKLTNQELFLIKILQNLQHSEAAKYYVVFVLNLFAKKTSKDQKNPKDFANLPFVKKLASPHLFKIFSDLLCARPFIGLTDEQMHQHNASYNTKYRQDSVLTPAELKNLKSTGYEVKRSQLEAPEVAKLVLENYQKAQEVRSKLKSLLNLYNNIRPFAGEEGGHAYKKLKKFAGAQAETPTILDNNAGEVGADVDADVKMEETKALAQELLQRASQASEPAQVELNPREVEQYRPILEKIGIDMPETKELTEEDVLGLVGFQNQNKALTELVKILDWLISKPDLLKIMHKRQATVLEIVTKLKEGSKGGAKAAKDKVGSIKKGDSDLCRNLTAFFELYDLTQGKSKPQQDNSGEGKINYNFKFENYIKAQNSWHVITNVLLFVYLIGLSCFYIFMNLSLACTLVCFGSFLFVGALLNWAFMVKPKVFSEEVDIFKKRASEHPSFTQFREFVEKNHTRLNPKLKTEFLFLAKALHSDGFVPLTEVRALAKAMGFEHSASVSFAYLWFTANNTNIAFAPKKPKAANTDNAEADAANTDNANADAADTDNAEAGAANTDNAEAGAANTDNAKADAADADNAKAGAVAVDIGVPEDGMSPITKEECELHKEVKTGSLLYKVLFKSKSFRTLSSLKLCSKVKTLKLQFSFDPNIFFESLQESINNLCQDYSKDAVAKHVIVIKETKNLRFMEAKAAHKSCRERLITKNYQEYALSNAYNSLNNFHSHWLLLILFSVLAVGSSVAYAFRTTVHYGFLMIALLFVGAASILFIKQSTVSAARFNFEKACRNERDSIIECVMSNNAQQESSGDSGIIKSLA